MSENFFKKYQIKAKKALWQNFLVDESKVQAIADFIDVKEQNIIEVWPGYGALTEKLVKKSPKSLTLVELDQDMVKILEDRELWDVTIVNEDILKYNPEHDDYSVIANIPYYITSPILRHFLYNLEYAPKKMLILMQKDVWDKIVLGQNEKKIRSSVLSLFIAKKCYTKEVIEVPKECFEPSPKVESSVIYFEIHDTYKNTNDDDFMKLIKIWFSSVRKKLIKNLVMGGFAKEKVLEVFKELQIDENIRGEVLGVDMWCKLVEKLRK